MVGAMKLNIFVIFLYLFFRSSRSRVGQNRECYIQNSNPVLSLQHLCAIEPSLCYLYSFCNSVYDENQISIFNRTLERKIVVLSIGFRCWILFPFAMYLEFFFLCKLTKNPKQDAIFLYKHAPQRGKF